ncbi:hypothetical protein LP43_1200 [Methylophaga thiooxydans]|uniref:Uncharacterized protein n=1 Tax=Methylophaga thiooxydans TaxID=392484 RepID=A0A0A0BKF8_9GAMM|nr:hypothetical protein [Methylophaga thiooxydans]KGM07584.1 hypothetical protein LP43_1200 [Methylophaga thiooxydans]
MREIEGLEYAVDVLRPMWEEIDQHFNDENKKFISIMKQDHDAIGRVLKAHIVVEHYLTIYLQQNLTIENIDDIKLTFAQKVALLPSSGSAVSAIKLGIKKLNQVRNKFAHRLEVELEELEINAINEVIRIFRPGVVFGNNLDRIEAFVTIAVTFLIVPPQELQELFAEAFSKVTIYEAI